MKLETEERGGPLPLGSYQSETRAETSAHFILDRYEYPQGHYSRWMMGLVFDA